jgi:hypothetical protein
MRPLAELAARWVMRVGGAPSARGASPWGEARFEWLSPRSPEAVAADLRRGITPRWARAGNAGRAAALTGLDRVSVIGHVDDGTFSLKAAAGIRTPWRQRIDGQVRVHVQGSELTASVSPSRWAGVYFAGASGFAVVVAVLLIMGAALSLPFAPDIAGQLLGDSFAGLFFAGVLFGIGRWSCQLGLNEAERLLTLVDGATGTHGTYTDAP